MIKINANTRLAVVIGHPVCHSLSPDMHNAAFLALGVNACYLAWDVNTEGLAACIAGLGVFGALGASITKPHKLAVMEHCDGLSKAAKAIGAVNTLEFRQDGSIVGHNTDGQGYVKGFEHETGTPLAGKRIVILGGGGAARAVHFGVQEAGAASLVVIVRSPLSVSWVDALPWDKQTLDKELLSCDVLIDCTSIGLNKENEENRSIALPLEKMPKDSWVSSLVYHRKTALLKRAEELGLQTQGGASMLVYQGALAFNIWTGQKAPIEAMKAALSEASGL